MTQYGYRYDRVLIEAERVLDSQFDDAVLTVSGAQLEILRNLMMYANRQATFVDTYYTNFYELPDDTDWDAIQAIVAELEERLMGNVNTPLGYYDRVFEEINDVGVPAATRTLRMTVVPSGYVYIIQAIAMRNDDSGVNQTKAVTDGNSSLIIERLSPAGAGLWHPLQVPNTVLKESDTIEGTFYNCTSGDDLHLKIWGYKMQVPA